MPDAEVEILIKAIDETSSTIKKVESGITSMQGAMLNLGQVAQSIHNIFETWENVNRRLENALDRVQNSEIRLIQATQALTDSKQKLVDIERKHLGDALKVERAELNLRKAEEERNKTLEEMNSIIKNRVTPTSVSYIATQKKLEEQNLSVREEELNLAEARELSTIKTEELGRANQDLQNKQDNLVISQNLLERSQRALEKSANDANWAYLDMGVAALTVAGNIGVLTTVLKGTGAGTGLAGALESVTAAAGIGGLAAVGGAAAALAGIYLISNIFPADGGALVEGLKAQITALEKEEKAAIAAGDAIQYFLNKVKQQKEVELMQAKYGTKSSRTDLGGTITDARAGAGVITTPIKIGTTSYNVKIDNVYGVSAEGISKALSRELSTKVGI